MKVIPFDSINVSTKRQRRDIAPKALVELASSIDRNGLLHPVVVRKGDKGYDLVAGERRLRAIEYLWQLGATLRCGESQFSENQVPVTFLGDLDPIDAFECELEENLRREDLSWQDRSEATAQLFELRRLQAEKRGASSPPSVAEFAKEVYPEKSPGNAHTATRKELIVSRHLKDPEVAKAKTLDEGLKVIQRKEEAKRNAQLGESVGRTFSRESHTLLNGNCLDIMEELPSNSFDVILTDPPYGINAQDFGDAGGRAHSTGHLYDDSYDSWLDLMRNWAPMSFRLAKLQAHLYVFCDVDNFLILRGIMRDAGWDCFRTPLIWNNPTSQRAPWPTCGPHRRYQMCLYAIKSKRPILKVGSDVVTYSSDPNLNWAAQKPVDLYRDFLIRSCRAGDTVLDSFAGSGTIFPAAHSLKIKATGIELDPVAYGIAAKRLQALK
jgi:ParB/RepB/Spo0J family partition protein